MKQAIKTQTIHTNLMLVIDSVSAHTTAQVALWWGKWLMLCTLSLVHINGTHAHMQQTNKKGGA